MNNLVRTALNLQEVLAELALPYTLIGGIAVQRWGQPRVTQDADANVYTGFGQEEETIQFLLDRYAGRGDDPAAFARMYRVCLLMDRVTDTAVDISLGADLFESRAIERSSLAEYEPGALLRTCSAEDLVVYKAFANRDLDWIDIKGVLIRQQGKLDFSLIESELLPLVELKEEPEIVQRWEAIKRRYP